MVVAQETSFEEALIVSLEQALAHKRGEVTLRTRVLERPAPASPVLAVPCLVVCQLSFDTLTASGRGFGQHVKKGLTNH